MGSTWDDDEPVRRPIVRNYATTGPMDFADVGYAETAGRRARDVQALREEIRRELEAEVRQQVEAEAFARRTPLAKTGPVGRAIDLKLGDRE